MNTPDPNPASGRVLNYAQPDGAKVRPARWVYPIVAIYALLLLGISAWISAVILTLHDNAISAGFGLLMVASVLLAEVGLLVIPVKVARNRPVARSSIWPAVFAAGLLGGWLFFGAGIALAELFRASEFHMTLVLIGSGLWAIWAGIFAFIALRRSAEGFGARLHRWLLAGSVLELLVAVPCHLIVRRRDECCAGIYTAMGICIGIVVMLLAFGPSIAFLYYRRMKQIRPK